MDPGLIISFSFIAFMIILTISMFTARKLFPKSSFSKKLEKVIEWLWDNGHF